MRLTDLHRVLDAALQDASNRISLTVTEVPEAESQLVSLLDGAVGAALRNGSSLAEIQIHLPRFPALGTDFLRVPITESGDPAVLRLIYDPGQPSAN